MKKRKRGGIAMKEIENRTFPTERALYRAKDIRLISCRFAGEEDGESALKETENVELISCLLDLRYPLWHGKNLMIKNSEMTSSCRAALWYSSRICIEDSRMDGIKALRECEDIEMKRTDIFSPEFGWKSRNIEGSDLSVESEYLFFEARNIRLHGLKFKGKYSFQYVKNVEIVDSELDTKDAFWHAENVVVRNSTVKGEYLAWYSENVTFIDCTIIGTQPLCYAKKLTLIRCRCVRCDLAFEYSDVDADLIGSIDSIKNPRSGTIVVDEAKELIFTSDSVYPPLGKVIQRKERISPEERR